MPGRTVAQLEKDFDALESIVMSTESETLEGVTFEVGVESGDIVYLDDEANIWKQSLAQNQARSRFYGVAIIGDTDKVQISGLITDTTFTIWDEINSLYVNAFTSGKPLYASKTKTGTMTHDDTGLLCGIATGSHSFVMNLAFQKLTDTADYKSIRTVISNYSLVITDKIIYVDASAGDITITPPAASLMVSDNGTATIMIKRIDSSINTVTITGIEGDDVVFDGSGGLPYIKLISDGTTIYLGD